MPIPELTDTQKLRIIPQLKDAIEELYQIIVTGDAKTNSPGLMETIRSTGKNVEEIKSSLREEQKRFKELERRVALIEERHKIVDAENKIADAQQEKRGKYQLAVFIMVITNIGIIIMQLMGWGK